MDNPLSQAETWDLVASGYETDTVPYLEPYSQDALDLLCPKPQERCLDIACGPGTTTFLLAQSGAHTTAIDFSESMLGELRQKKAARGVRNLEALYMDGQDLRFGDQSFDLAVSMFGMIFFPDPVQGAEEMYRVLRSGGRACIGAWAPLDQSPSLRAMYGSLFAVFPEFPRPEEGSAKLSPLEDPVYLRSLMEGAGFQNVEIHARSHAFSYSSVEEAWGAIERGSAPFVLGRKMFGEESWPARKKAGIRYLRETFGEGQIEVGSAAFLGTGVKP